MKHLRVLLRSALAVFLFAGSALCNAQAQTSPSAAPYQGKVLTIISGASGGYDAYAHLLANHMKKYVPGAPTVIARNMPGAASMLAANYIYNVAAPDGLTFGGFVRTIPMAPLLGNKAAKYSPEKFTWIGSSSRYLDDVYLLMVSKRLGITTVEQLKNRAEPLRLGSTGPSSQTDEGGRIIGEALGIKFHIIRGYQTTPQIVLAVERGEVDGMMWGISSMSSSRPEWLQPNPPVNYIFQFGYGGEGRHPMFANVPRIDELATTPEQRGLFDLLQLPFKVSRPFAGPPNMPADLTAILRDAFMRTHSDPDYLQEAKKMGLDVSASSGEEVQRVIDRAVSLPHALIDRYAELLNKP